MNDPSSATRSLMKGTTWESFSYLLTLLIAYWYTGSVRTSVELTSICFVIKILLFFVHERIWHQIKWGKAS